MVALRRAPGCGDTHLTMLGTDGLVEVRYIDCGAVEPPYGRQLVHDVLHRTETVMSQAHCFLATELALRAQLEARVVRRA